MRKHRQKDPAVPLATLLSQSLVAFTVELDNEFEHQMCESGYPGARLSLVLWSNFFQFVLEEHVSVGELAARARVPYQRIKVEMGCLERWGFIVLQGNQAADQSTFVERKPASRNAQRDGWGSGRGIRKDWILRLTPMGLRAIEIWPPLIDLVEHRWRMRFGAEEIIRLRNSLQAVVRQLNMDLPEGLLPNPRMAEAQPSRTPPQTAILSLPALLSQLLTAFTLEFDCASPAPLSLCANTIRVLSEEATRLEEIAPLTGCSPETSAIGWQLRPYVIIEPDRSGRRGKVVRLTPLGLKTQQSYWRLISEIESRWKLKFGENTINGVRDALRSLFSHQTERRSTMSLGLIPPQDVVRAGKQAPALGRQKVASAARQRLRDLVAQTEELVRDPAGTLPHYPLWDMNRGFGP